MSSIKKILNSVNSINNNLGKIIETSNSINSNIGKAIETSSSIHDNFVKGRNLKKEMFGGSKKETILQLLQFVKKCRKYKDIYKIPFELSTNKTLDTNLEDIKIVLFVNACYGSGDKVFCLKIYNYIKEWYGIESTIMTSTPEYFINNGVTNLLGVKIPGKSYVECANIKDMKIYNVDSNGKFLKRTTPKEIFDIILVTPWIGTDYEPNHNTMKKFFPYSNRFNTFLFSSYNPPKPYLYDFPTGIGKGFTGVLLTETVKGEKNPLLDRPYVMTHISYYHSVDVNGCYNRFVELICRKYYKLHPQIDIVTPKLILDEPKKIIKLIKYIKSQNYYDEVEVVTEKDNMKIYPDNTRVLRLRMDLLPLPYKEYVSLFDYCLPDVLLTGNQSVTDIISCCKNYNVYYQIMPWERNFARNLNNTSEAPNDYLKNVRTACGYSKMPLKTQIKLQKVQEKYDFRVIGKAKMDKIVNNIKWLSSKDGKIFVDIVSSSRKKSTIINKLKQL